MTADIVIRKGCRAGAIKGNRQEADEVNQKGHKPVHGKLKCFADHHAHQCNGCLMKNHP